MYDGLGVQEPDASAPRRFAERDEGDAAEEARQEEKAAGMVLLKLPSSPILTLRHQPSLSTIAIDRKIGHSRASVRGAGFVGGTGDAKVELRGRRRSEASVDLSRSSAQGHLLRLVQVLVGMVRFSPREGFGGADLFIAAHERDFPRRLPTPTTSFCGSGTLPSSPCYSCRLVSVRNFSDSGSSHENGHVPLHLRTWSIGARFRTQVLSNQSLILSSC